MKKKILSFILCIVLTLSLFPALPVAAAPTTHATAVQVGHEGAYHLNEGGHHWYRITATETQYHSFIFRNKSLEANTGIGFLDSFVNLFVGKMTVEVYDQLDEHLASLDVKCGYNGTLSLNLTQGETYYFKVSSSVSGNYTMNVKMLNDLGGNNWKNSLETTSTGQLISRVDAAGDQDWFKFTTDDNRSFVNFSLENVQAGTLELWVYESVGGNEDTLPRDVFNFDVYNNNTKSKSTELKPNTTYYFCIQGENNATGDYILSLERSIDAAGPDKETAYLLQRDVKYTSSFDGPYDTDYYKFTTGDQPAYYLFDFKGTVFTYSVGVTVYDEAGNPKLDIGSYNGKTSGNVKLEPHTLYYVKVASDSSLVGNYEFTITTKPDAYPNTKAEATAVQRDQTITSGFEGSKDIDYLKFTTAETPAYYLFDFKGTSFTYSMGVTVYDEAGNPKLDIGSYNGKTSGNVKLEPNTLYYVKVASDSTLMGNYEFTITTKPDAYPDTRAEAVNVSLDQTITSGFEGSKDIDYLKFTTTPENAYYQFAFKGTGFTYSMAVTVYDETGNPKLNVGSYNGKATGNVKLEPNALYYVKVASDSTLMGDYEFTITAKPDPEGDTKATAYPLSMNETYQSALSDSKDTDWYKVTLNASVDLLVTVNNESCSSLGFKVYNDRDQPFFDNNTYNNKVFTDHGRLEKGTYYIKVTGGSEGYYTIALSPCGSGHNYIKGKCGSCGKWDPNYAPTFTDVSKKAWYKGAIDYVAKYNIMGGVGNGKMQPNANVTRAQFVQILANLEGVDTTNTRVSTRFSDVPAGKWFTPAVKWASENGIVDGVGNGKFDPNGNLTREQMCKMIVSYVTFKGITLEKTTAKISFTDDRRISGWAYDYVYLCQQAGLVNGIGTDFKPRDLATRAQIATIMMRFDQQYEIVEK